MKATEYLEVKQMADRLIAFIKWKGAPFEKKQKTVIKEISLIKQYCLKCITDAQENTQQGGGKVSDGY